MSILKIKAGPTTEQAGVCDFEFKFSEPVGEAATFTGYGSMFGNIDNGRDMVVKGAFAETLAAKPTNRIKMLWQHDPAQPIGAWEELKEDGKGLFCKGRLMLSLARGRESYELMKAGVVDGLSMGYRTLKESYDTEKGGRGYRKIEKVDLWEVSLVTFPMNPKAGVVAVKQMPTDRELESMLRDEAGLSNREAKAAVSVFKKILRDGGSETAESPRDAGLSVISSELDALLAIIRS